MLSEQEASDLDNLIAECVQLELKALTAHFELTEAHRVLEDARGRLERFIRDHTTGPE